MTSKQAPADAAAIRAAHAFDERHRAECRFVEMRGAERNRMAIYAVCCDCGEELIADISRATALRCEHAINRVGPDDEAIADALQAIADDLLVGRQVH